jgi:hypothetical protein
VFERAERFGKVGKALGFFLLKQGMIMLEIVKHIGIPKIRPDALRIFMREDLDHIILITLGFSKKTVECQ